MRVIGGSRRGLRLAALPGRATRPTADRVKEALFNILAARVPGARVLDLFAGTGALGIEALSRGAASACFVERSPKAARVLRANVEKARFQAQACIVAGDVLRVLPRLAEEGASFDLILIDPPYGRGLGVRSAASAAALGLLSPGGVVVIEHEAEEDMPDNIENLVKIRSARYGRTVLSFFRLGGAEDVQGGGG